MIRTTTWVTYSPDAGKHWDYLDAPDLNNVNADMAQVTLMPDRAQGTWIPVKIRHVRIAFNKFCDYLQHGKAVPYWISHLHTPMHASQWGEFEDVPDLEHSDRAR